ncbi:MAG TPA: acriflavin resistance protein [Bradyrhizobium sp.]|uniref:acriflavin resistance protein n=1 Tax=Bradyrhizobium sp. TaxID=376 RepID=UPI002B88C886|nr:acriflavin resistance protein [Bradyrhizobium sp.]HLZ06683.1 acriflavin resistance protein [Bradyrhizobium sp.]
MNITTPLLKGASEMAALPGDTVASFLKAIGDFTGLYGDGPHGGLGLVTSGLAGIATALAVAIALTIYFHTGERTVRGIAKHGVAAVVALALAAFVISDMRQAALAYLGLNPSKRAVEFEIRMPKTELSAISDTQIELHTDRNQRLARVEGTADANNGQSVLRGVVALDYRTTDRVVVLNLPGLAQCEFKLRLAAEPSRSATFGPWHLADRVALANGEADANAHDAYAIRYRVF